MEISLGLALTILLDHPPPPCSPAFFSPFFFSGSLVEIEIFPTFSQISLLQAVQSLEKLPAFSEKALCFAIGRSRTTLQQSVVCRQAAQSIVQKDEHCKNGTGLAYRPPPVCSKAAARRALMLGCDCDKTYRPDLGAGISQVRYYELIVLGMIPVMSCLCV